MSLLPEGASYEEVVAEVFLAVAGRGLMLSALDGALVSEWAERGVPLDAVARAIRRTAEKAEYDRRPGEPILRSLRACRREVEAEWKKHLRTSAGEGTGERSRGEKKREGGVRQSLLGLAERRPDLVNAVDRALRAVEQLSDDRRDEAVVLLLLRGCPHPERVAILREAKELWQQGNVFSARARKLARRFHLSATVRRALALPSFW